MYELQVVPAGPAAQSLDGQPLLIHNNAAIALTFNAKGRKAALDVGHLTEWDGSAISSGLSAWFAAAFKSAWYD